MLIKLCAHLLEKVAWYTEQHESLGHIGSTHVQQSCRKQIT